MQVDLSQLPAGIRQKMDEIFRKDFELKTLQAIRRQQRAAALNHLQRPRARDGFGPRTLEIDAWFDAFWRTCYGHNYTEDQELVKFLVRRNPEIGVRSQGTKLMVGWQAGAGSRRPVGVKPQTANLKPQGS